MRLVCISDLHGQLPEIPDCDLLLISGDICPTSDHSSKFQIKWLDTIFRRWLETIPANDVVACAGNHDFVFQTHFDKIPDLLWTYLNVATAKFDSLKVFGSPWQNWFYDWAFNAPKPPDGEGFLAKVYESIPDDVDIIVTHGPPFGGDPRWPHLADYTRPFGGRPAEHVGSKSLIKRMTVVSPKLLVTGHIHGGYGVYPINLAEEDQPEKSCLVVNASVLNERYIMTHEPLQFEAVIDEKTGRCTSIERITNAS
jgi:Icc-related predicted phosphoesterase